MRDTRWRCPRCNSVNKKSALQRVYEKNILNGVELFGDETCFSCFRGANMASVYSGLYDTIEAPPLEPRPHDRFDSWTDSYESTYALSLEATRLGEEQGEVGEISGPIDLETQEPTFGIPGTSSGGFSVTQGFETGSTAIHPPHMTPTPRPERITQTEIHIPSLMGDGQRRPTGPLAPLPPGRGVPRPPMGEPPEPVHFERPGRVACPVCLTEHRQGAGDLNCPVCSFIFSPLPFLREAGHLNHIADREERERYFKDLIDWERAINDCSFELADRIMNDLLDANPSSDLLWINKALLTYWRSAFKCFPAEHLEDLFFYTKKGMGLPGHFPYKAALVEDLADQLERVARYIQHMGREFCSSAGSSPSPDLLQKKYARHIRASNALRKLVSPA